MTASTDADYNALSRAVDCKVNIYLDGEHRAPVVLSNHDGLISVKVLDEASSDSSNPFGNVTSNELTLTIANVEGLYTPTNESSPYFGKMRRGVKCELFFRVVTDDEELDWDQCGVFYVTEWKAAITSITASITANDRLYDIFDSTDAVIPVVQNTNFLDFYSQVFSTLGVDASVDPALTQSLVMSYNVSNNNKLLSNMAIGSLATITCGHDGDIAVRSLTAHRAVRATITDSDQIKTANAEVSINVDYDGGEVTLNAPQESVLSEVLSINSMTVPPGTTTSESYALAKKPLIRLAYASLIGDEDAIVADIDATSLTVAVKTYNSKATAVELGLDVHGYYLESIATTIGDTGSNLMSVDNIYIQTAEQANRYLTIMRAIAATPMPVLTLEVRGNPKWNIGDVLVAQSDKYNLDFTGVLLKQDINYMGSLSSTITLFNADLLEV